MAYLEYEEDTKQVVEIHQNEPMLKTGYSYGTTENFAIGDEFEYTIWVNEVDENKNIVSYSAIRNNPQAKRLLEENEDLKKDKKMFNLKVDALTNQNEMLESVIQELIMTVIP